MILQPAQVAAAQCNFVAKVIEYKKCLRYQLDCCLQEEAAKEAYLLWRWAKLDETDCTLPDAQLCSIQGLEILPSTCSSTPACADLLSSSVKQQTSGGGYTKAVENDFDSSAYMSITLTPNSVAQPAGASAIGGIASNFAFKSLIANFISLGTKALIASNNVCFLSDIF